jgi:hypothetical protein
LARRQTFILLREPCSKRRFSALAYGPPHGAEAKSQIGAYDAELDFCGCNYHSSGPIWAGSAQHGAIDDKRRAHLRAIDIMFAPCGSAYSMTCCVRVCCVMLSYETVRYLMMRYAILCCLTVYHAILSCAILSYVCYAIVCYLGVLSYLMVCYLMLPVSTCLMPYLTVCYLMLPVSTCLMTHACPKSGFQAPSKSVWERTPCNARAQCTNKKHRQNQFSSLGHDHQPTCKKNLVGYKATSTRNSKKGRANAEANPPQMIELAKC